MLLLLSSRPAATFLLGQNLDYQDKGRALFIGFNTQDSLDLTWNWAHMTTRLRKGILWQKECLASVIGSKIYKSHFRCHPQDGKILKPNALAKKLIPSHQFWVGRFFTVCEKTFQWNKKGRWGRWIPTDAVCIQTSTSISHFLLSIVSESSIPSQAGCSMNANQGFQLRLSDYVISLARLQAVLPRWGDVVCMLTREPIIDRVFFFLLGLPSKFCL